VDWLKKLHVMSLAGKSCESVTIVELPGNNGWQLDMEF